MRKFKKNIFQIINILFIIERTKCFNIDGKNGGSDGPPDNMKVLEELKNELQMITTEIAKFETIIYILIPTAIILFLILFGLTIYEIIKCLRKKETILIDDKKYFSQLLDSSSDSSSQKKKSNNNEIKNSFHSSTVTDSINSNNLKQSEVLNSLNDNINVKDSNIKASNNRSLSGCEAPLVQELKPQWNKEENKFYTNDGEEDGNENIKFVTNPFVK